MTQLEWIKKAIPILNELKRVLVILEENRRAVDSIIVEHESIIKPE